MTIKERIYQKIEEIKREFKEETGIELVAFPSINVEKEEIKQVKEVVEKITKIKLPNVSKKQEVVWAKLIFVVTLDNMGYVGREIAEVTGVHRTNIVKYRSSHHKNMLQIVGYKRLYNKVLAEIHKKQNIEKWEKLS